MPNDRILKNKGAPDVSGVKRLYIPGLVIASDCPKCGETSTAQYDDHYVSYLGERGSPVATGNMYCGECETEWTMRIEITVRADAKVVADG